MLRLGVTGAVRCELANMRLQLLQVQRRRDFLVAAILLEKQRQHQQQRRRTMWVKPLLLRRVTLGHYDTHSHSRADARVTRKLQVLSAHGTGDV